jgi:hypothetical protein
VEPLARANEKPRAEVVLKLANARRHVGLNAMQALGSTGHATFTDDRREDLQIG